MRRGEPDWWYADPPGLTPRLLAPAGWLYGAAAVARYRLATPAPAARPVVCVGNFTAGGTGKTPLTIAIAEIVREIGFEPWALSRGYGGSLAGPVRITLGDHAATDVGDEPLLLARSMPTVVARDRRAGAARIAETATDRAVILMDDGLQNPAIRKDLSFAVVDRGRGLGNGRVIPAGPLRAPLEFQAPQVDALIINGSPESPLRADVAALAEQVGGPAISAWPVVAGVEGEWRGRRVVAFAGIANPARFAKLLEGAGAVIVAFRGFGDHHPFTDREAEELLAQAQERSAVLVTTEKDAARLVGRSGAVADLAAHCEVLRIRMAFASGDKAKLASLLTLALDKS
ncbi:MAG: tetraacyldisaccharide 4'-kinase [Hyphomicrobium sp.]